MWNRLRWPRRGLWIFLGVWAAFSVCRPFVSYDSYWTVPVALNLLQHARTDVDPWIASAPLPAQDVAECVLPARPAVRYLLSQGCPGGRVYNFFPLGVSLLALPVLALLKALFPFVAPFVPPSFPLLAIPQVAAFVSGDWIQGHALAELLTASLFGALAVFIQYRIYLRFLSPRVSTLLALLFAFGTPEWSVGSRSLTQHGLSVLLLSLTLYLLLRSFDQPSLVRFASLPLALAFLVRPSNAISVLAITAFVALHRREHFPRFLLLALPVAIPFFAYNLLVRHALFPLYYTTPPPFRSILPGLAMQLFSPSRGLLVFTPVFLLSLPGLILAWRKRWLFPLLPYLAAIVAFHALVVSLWWPGHCYGSRYFTDMTPLFVLFLIPVVDSLAQARPPWRTALRLSFALLALWGVFTHGRGATSVAANSWSITPLNVDDVPARVWDWRDPQFLRGFFLPLR